MLVGYARSSVENDTIELQKITLKEMGCQRIYKERTTNTKAPRPVLKGALDFMNEGDVLVVCQLDRLARSLKELVAIIGQLKSQGMALRSVAEGIDTSGLQGEAVYAMLCGLVDFEYRIVQERTQVGLQVAREQGKVGGRPSKLTPEIIQKAKSYYQSGKAPKEICHLLGIGRTSFFKAVAA